MQHKITIPQQERLANLKQRLQHPLEDLSETEYRQVESFYLLTRYAKELERQVERDGISLETCLTGWLQRSRKKTQLTQEQYTTWVSKFIGYLNDHGVHFLDVQAKEVDEFIAWLRDTKRSAETVRNIVAGCSSFFTYLERYNYIQRNYFRGADRPKSTKRKTADEISNSRDILIVQQQLKEDILLNNGQGYHKRKHQALYFYPVFHVLCEYGLRVRALPTFKIDRANYGTVFSKEEAYGFPVEERTLKLLKKYGFKARYPFPEVKPGNVQKAFARICERCFGRADRFSVHDLRHYFAKKLYLETKDPLRIKNALGHKSLATTDRYLATLNVDSATFNPDVWFDIEWD